MEQQDPHVIAFRAREVRAELARLKRLTGLDFEQVPESLLVPAKAAATVAPAAEGKAPPVRALSDRR